jgi:hypothetical protein
MNRLSSFQCEQQHKMTPDLRVTEAGFGPSYHQNLSKPVQPDDQLFHTLRRLKEA